MKYCSDFNFRGLCGYHDNDLSCTCTETMNDSHRAYMSGKCTSDQVRLFVICLLVLSATHVPYFPNWFFSNIQAISIATNNIRQLTAGVPFVLTTMLSQMTQRHLSCAPPVQRSIRSIHYVPKTGAHVAKYTQTWIKILVFGINNRVCSIRISSTRLPT